MYNSIRFNYTFIVQISGTHLGCEEDVADFEFKRYLAWMDLTVCEYKKLEISEQQKRISQETNSLANSYENCNAQFQYEKIKQV